MIVVNPRGENVLEINNRKLSAAFFVPVVNGELGVYGICLDLSILALLVLSIVAEIEMPLQM